MLDMDGTVLDLAYDNYMWMQHVPQRYAAENGLALEDARDHLYAKFKQMQGQLEWYCLDFWSEFLDLDVADLHRRENHRIAYLPGAQAFLQAVCDSGKRLLLVTNSHRETLEIKDDVTDIRSHFDDIYTSHALGYPKEHQGFWQALAEIEAFDPARTLFVDDTARVLRSAAKFGVAMLAEITQPDTSAPPRQRTEYNGVKRLGDLL